MLRKISAKKTLAALLALVMLMGTLSVLPVTVSAATIESCAPKGTANVAVGSTVTLSKCTANRAGAQNSYEMPTENWSKAMLVDGKLGNGWSTDPYDKETDRSKPVTVTLELPSRAEISCVALFPNGCFPAKYTVSISSDGKNFKKVADGTCDIGKPTEPAVHTFAAQSAKYVEIHVTERSHTVTGDGALVQFGEIAVYGKAEAAMTTHRTAYELLVGDTDTITPIFIGTGSETPAVTYKSNDASVVTVDANGNTHEHVLGSLGDLAAHLGTVGALVVGIFGVIEALVATDAAAQCLRKRTGKEAVTAVGQQAATLQNQLGHDCVLGIAADIGIGIAGIVVVGQLQGRLNDHLLTHIPVVFHIVAYLHDLTAHLVADDYRVFRNVIGNALMGRALLNRLVSRGTDRVTDHPDQYLVSGNFRQLKFFQTDIVSTVHSNGFCFHENSLLLLFLISL